MTEVLEKHIKLLHKQGKSKADILYEIITETLTIFYQIQLEESDGVEEL